MIQAEDILEVMGRQAKSVCAKVYPQDRPNATDAKLTEFIVVSIPYSESIKMLGEDDDWWLDQTVVFEIYVADKKAAANPKQYNDKRMKTLRSQLTDLFPIIDGERRFKITRPRMVITATSDGNGYHFTRVQAKMTTMV